MRGYFVAAGAFAAVLVTGGQVWALSSFGPDCAQCHTGSRGTMTITAHDTSADPVEACGAPNRGLLKVFQVPAGGTKTLSGTLSGLTTGAKYAGVAKGFQANGVQACGALSFTGDPAWQLQAAVPTYYTLPLGSAVYTWPGNTAFNFNITVGGATPPDFYELVLAVAGKDGSGRFYTEARFYLHVLSSCPPLSIVSSVSRKSHGTAGAFDVPSGGWEGRVKTTALQGPDTIVTVFNQSVQRLNGDNSDVSVSSGTVGSIAVTGDMVTVTLTGIANRATFTIGYPGIAASCDAGMKTAEANCWQVLAGEASGGTTSIIVNTSDYVYVRGRIGQAVGSDNFRADVNTDGAINTSDYVAIRGRIDSLFSMVPTCP